MNPRSPLVAIMLRPSSLAFLVLAITVAVGFALFGQWQLGRAIQNGTVVNRTTEQVRALSDVAEPQQSATGEAVGQRVSVDGSWTPDEFAVLADRLDNGRSGYWVTGHFVTSDDVSLAVALGWTPDEQTALDEAAAANAGEPLPTALVGRYQQSEDPTVPADDAAYPTDLAVSALINEWTEVDSAYAGYLTIEDTVGSLQPIWSPPPSDEVQLNFLNLFYATEWALFSVVALYIWYRLMKDIAEREREESELGLAGAAVDGPEDATGAAVPAEEGTGEPAVPGHPLPRR